jgi:hypothetical protein
MSSPGDIAYNNTDFQNILIPPFYQNTANTFATTRGLCHFIYMGKSGKFTDKLGIMMRITTAHVTPAWAEIGIFTGPLNIQSSTNLSRHGVKDVSGHFYSGGASLIHVRKFTIELDKPITPNQDVWFAIGCSAATQPILRGNLADYLQTGASQVSGSNTRLSLIGTTGPFTTTLAGENQAVPDIVIGI